MDDRPFYFNPWDAAFSVPDPAPPPNLVRVVGAA